MVNPTNSLIHLKVKLSSVLVSSFLELLGHERHRGRHSAEEQGSWEAAGAEKRVYQRTATLAGLVDCTPRPELSEWIETVII